MVIASLNSLPSLFWSWSQGSFGDPDWSSWGCLGGETRNFPANKRDINYILRVPCPWICNTNIYIEHFVTHLFSTLRDFTNCEGWITFVRYAIPWIQQMTLVCWLLLMLWVTNWKYALHLVERTCESCQGLNCIPLIYVIICNWTFAVKEFIVVGTMLASAGDGKCIRLSMYA